MKYIKSFETHRKKESINEEFIGGLWKKLKNKLSLSFSKNFGSAKDVENLITEYKTILSKISVAKNEILSQYSKYLKENEKPDANKTAEFNKKYKTAEDNFKQQVEVEKKRFDIKFNAIIADEKNPKIKEFIQLKKLEMQSELLKDELKSIAGTLSQKEIDDLVKSDKDFKLIFDTLIEKNKKIDENSKKMADSLEKTEQKEESSYVSIGDKNMEKVKSKDGFKNSPFVNGEFSLKEGDIVTYWFGDFNNNGKNAKEISGKYIGPDKTYNSKVKLKITNDKNEEEETSIFKKRIISKGEKNETKPDEEKTGDNIEK
jgi:hypothetical protein